MNPSSKNTTAIIFGLIIAFALGIAADRLLFQRIDTSKLLGSIESGITREKEEKNEEPKTPETATGEIVLVTRVIDGDTIEIEGGKKVRYIGIDSPESVDLKNPVQCFSKEAFEQNKKLVESKKVLLIKDVSETDRYSRLLRYVYVNDRFINFELVKNGYAIATPYPPDTKFANTFKSSADKAKSSKKGLWGKCPEEFTGNQVSY